MKRFSVCLCGLLMVLWMADVCGASPVSIDVATSYDSSVTVSDVWSPFTNLQAGLAYGLGANSFILNDNQTQAFNFITLIGSGTGLLNTSRINATLAFDNLPIAASGVGTASWDVLANNLTRVSIDWGTTVPDIFTLADGNRLRIAFEDDITLGLNSQVFVRASVTNLGSGSGTAPVPEPGTIILLGAGLAGLGLYGRRRMKIQG